MKFYFFVLFLIGLCCINHHAAEQKDTKTVTLEYDPPSFEYRYYPMRKRMLTDFEHENKVLKKRIEELETENEFLQILLDLSQTMLGLCETLIDV